MVYKRIQLKPGKEASLQRFHPWIFSGAVRSVEEKPEEGEVVDVFTARNEFIARGHYQQGSITVRVLTFQQEEINADFWYNKLKSAYDMRVTLGLAESITTNAYRLVYGEGDGLPGLIIDVYNHTAVMQTHTAGMHQSRKEIVDALMKLMDGKLENIYYKSEATLAAQEKMSSTDGYLKGGNGENIAMENGLKFHVDWLKGQKTGFFVDQRENRVLVERYAKGKTVLNMFCYTGGFSFYALRGGAKLVHSVDSSAKAIELTNRNVELNFPDCTCHQAFVDDAFNFLNGMNDTYDLIILDPPAFAKHKAAIHNALKGYTRLNAKAFEKIRHGGLLFTFSCSQVVDKISFRNVVLTAAVQSGRSVRILHQLTQPADHPINIFHPEGEYLKGLVVYVE